MKFDRAISLLQEFDYERNGKDHTIDFLRYVAKELEDYEEEKKIEKIPYMFNLKYVDTNDKEVVINGINDAINGIYDKINEIIDFLEEK